MRKALKHQLSQIIDPKKRYIILVFYRVNENITLSHDKCIMLIHYATQMSFTYKLLVRDVVDKNYFCYLENFKMVFTNPRKYSLTNSFYNITLYTYFLYTQLKIGKYLLKKNNYRKCKISRNAGGE